MRPCDSIRDDIPLLLTGDIEDPQRARVREHLAACAACVSELMDQSRVVSLLRSSEEVLAPRPARRQRIAASAAALLLAFVAGIAFGRNPSSTTAARAERDWAELSTISSDLGRGLLALRGK